MWEIRPDLTIYLKGRRPKPSAEYAGSRADIISGRLVRADVPTLAARLGITLDLMRTIVRLAGGNSAEPEAEDSG